MRDPVMRDLEAVLAAHFERHRALEPQDVYKLLYRSRARH